VWRDRKSAKKGKINPKNYTKLTSRGKNGPKIPETPSVFLALSRLLLISATRTDTCPWQPSHAHLASQSCVLDVMLQSISSPRAEGASPPPVRCTLLKKCIYILCPAVTRGSFQFAAFSCSRRDILAVCRWFLQSWSNS
jgi:hypothetical protein